MAVEADENPPFATGLYENDGDLPQSGPVLKYPLDPMKVIFTRAVIEVENTKSTRSKGDPEAVVMLKEGLPPSVREDARTLGRLGALANGMMDSAVPLVGVNFMPWVEVRFFDRVLLSSKSKPS